MKQKTVKLNAAYVIKEMPNDKLKKYNIPLEPIDGSSTDAPEWFKPYGQTINELKEFAANQQKFNELIMKRLDNLVKRNNLKE